MGKNLERDESFQFQSTVPKERKLVANKGGEIEALF
jgi:hypothetical protein